MTTPGRICMSGSELRRFRVINNLMEKRVTTSEAALDLKISVRQVKRLRRKVKEQGESGIIHGLVGKKSNHQLENQKEEKIISIWNEKYRAASLNFNHFTEKLNEIEKVKVSKETVRRILRAKNLSDSKPNRGRKHRSHRERRACFGELLQQDTSPHEWLPNQKHHLVVTVDDATSALLHCELFEHDGTISNMTVMKKIFTEYGLCLGIYTDQAAWFHYAKQGTKLITHKSNKTPQESETQIERALNQLGIKLILAHSPQAKGRVERMNRTLQDRLIAELKLAGITQLKKANWFIQNVFIPDHNKRFAKAPSNPQSAFTKLSDPKVLDEILCQQFYSQVQNDNTVTKVDRYRIQLLPSGKRQSWVKAKVIVRILTDGSLRIRHRMTNELIPHKVIELHLVKEAKHISIPFDGELLKAS